MIKKRGLFDFLFSILATFFVFALFFGQIIFLVIGFTIGIFDWGIDGVLCIGFGAFCPLILIVFLLMLFGGWRYWEFDENGVCNGNLILKKRLLFSEIERYEIKSTATSYNLKGHLVQIECIVFYKNNRNIKIPLWGLTSDELSFLKSKVEKNPKTIQYEIQ